MVVYENRFSAGKVSPALVRRTRCYGAGLWNSVPHGYVQYLSHIIPATSSQMRPVTTGFFMVVRAKQQTTTHTSGRGHIRSEEEDSVRTSSCRGRIGMRRFRESVAPAGVIHDIDFIFLAFGRLIRSTIGCPPERPSASLREQPPCT